MQCVKLYLSFWHPRRHELLNQVKIAHSILSVTIDETQFVAESPTDYIQRMVAQKATMACSSLTPKNFIYHHQCLVITADTIGVLSSGQVLQKPRDFIDACDMWRQMSGTTHEVWTAVQVSRIQRENAIVKITQSQQVMVKTAVNFIPLTDSMMKNYWDTGEPQDKAGGYAIQGQGMAWVKAIHGSYSNVVGLPMVETIELINRLSKI